MASDQESTEARPFNIEVERLCWYTFGRESFARKAPDQTKREGRRTDLKHPPSFLVNQPRNPLDSTSSSKSSNSGFSDSPTLSANLLWTIDGKREAADILNIIPQDLSMSLCSSFT